MRNHQHHQQLRFEAFPEDQLTLALYRDVSNATYAYLNPGTTVAGVFAVHLAAHTALASHHAGKLASKTLQTEVIHNISGSTHVAEGLKRFGVTEGTKHLLVACLNASQEQVQQLDSLVKGTPTPLSELTTLADKDLISKYYKITDRELMIGSLEDAVACRIAAMDA